MFARIARRYDAANNAISFGMHLGWKRRLVNFGGAGLWPVAGGTPAPPICPGARVLDCACGTGDVAFAALRRVLPGGEVVGVDFTPEMVEQARAKAERLEDGWLQVPGEAELARKAISFEVGDVLHLPYPDNSFDAATIAFGVRNLDDPVRGLLEMARVVKPGGVLLILESGMPVNRLWRALYGLYQSSALWLIGGLVAGDVGAYRYFSRTSRSFPSGQAFVALVQQAEVTDAVEAIPIAGGVGWIYRAIVS